MTGVVLQSEDDGMETGGQQQPLVVIVDDDEAARVSLGRLLATEGYAVHEFGSVRAMLSSPRASECACVVTDLRMPGMTGLDLQQAMTERDVRAPLVFVTAFGTIPVSVQAMRGGAIDFLEKPADPDELLGAVARAIERHRENRRSALLCRDVTNRWERLTAREREVFEGVVRGLTNKAIGEELGIAIKTVKVHRGRVMEKMEADSLADLVRMRALLS